MNASDPIEQWAGEILAEYETLPKAGQSTVWAILMWVFSVDMLRDRPTLAAWLAQFTPETRSVLREAITLLIHLEALRSAS